jgi:GntR family transcriptional regulator
VTRLDKYSPVPLYQQLVQALAARIDSREFEPGDRIPSEREIAEQMRVSRTTARLAVEELVASGRVYREQGRGTYVAEPAMRGLLGFASFSEDMQARGRVPRSTILKQEVLAADKHLAEILHIEPGDAVLHLLRLRLADDEPVAVQSANLPLSLVPGLETLDLTDQSLFTILRKQYYIYPAWTEAEMGARKATDEQAHLLKLEPESPVLVVRGLTYSDSFEIVESVETVYRGQGLALYVGRQRFSSLRGGTP